MREVRRALPAAWILLLLGACTHAGEPATGWRGNGTGLWPEARLPLRWRRTPHGALEEMVASADRPAGAMPGMGRPVEKGLVRDWLVLGQFAVEDSVRRFDDDPLGGEAAVEPAAGEKLAGRTWTAAAVPPDDPLVFGEAELPWLDLAKVVGFQRNQLAYAHAYVHSPRGGRARIVVDHAHGLTAWLNGRVVYRSPERHVELGSYPAISRHELGNLVQPSPRFELELRPGWNRLLLKLSTSNKEDYTEMRCALRIMDPPDVTYDSQNVLWMTELPARSTSTPIVVGERLLLMAEPDELVCIDKRSGHIEWTAAVNDYEALTPDERRGMPALLQRVDPLVAELKQTKDRTARIKLRARIQQSLAEIDAERFRPAVDGHFESHFGIVGFTMPTPVSDGRHVYVWSGMGVAACFDLEGRRQWITRVATGPLAYGSSPALAEGVLAVFLNKLYGLNAKTGEILWEQPRIQRNQAAVLAVTLASQQVFVTQRGEVVRPSDGELLFRPGAGTLNDEGWSPPVVLDNVMYLPKYGVTQLNVFDFSAVAGAHWQPRKVATHSLPEEVSRRANGGWIDRWTAGSPLVWQGIAYQSDIYQSLYALDLKSGRMLYRREMELQGFTHYNSVAVAASPTLVGNHLLVLDNQGTTLVLEPGPDYKVVARNHIGTQLDRHAPLPAQETLAYAPPVVDGDRILLRGEAYLYCIGEK